MATEKMTKKQKYELMKAIPAVAENEMLVEFINKEIETLEKKNSSAKKPTAQQTENESIKTAILETMSANPTTLYTITELIKTVDACGDLTNQRVSALVNQLVDSGKVEKVSCRCRYPLSGYSPWYAHPPAHREAWSHQLRRCAYPTID